MTPNIAAAVIVTFTGLRLIGLLDVTDPQLQTIVDIVSSVGSTGILAMVVYWFLSGKLISAKVYEKQREAMKESVENMVVNKLTAGIANAVKQGMMEAWYEMREKDEQSAVTPRKTQPRRAAKP